MSNAQTKHPSEPWKGETLTLAGRKSKRESRKEKPNSQDPKRFLETMRQTLRLDNDEPSFCAVTAVLHQRISEEDTNGKGVRFTPFKHPIHKNGSERLYVRKLYVSLDEKKNVDNTLRMWFEAFDEHVNRVFVSEFTFTEVCRIDFKCEDNVLMKVRVKIRQHEKLTEGMYSLKHINGNIEEFFQESND